MASAYNKAMPSVPKGVDAFRLLTGASKLCESLKARSPNYINHRLSQDQSSPSRLLEISLNDFLPSSVNNSLPPYNSRLPYLLPPGYHLIHFPPPTRGLLPDGTDTLHYPGHPWVRRMWAGGSIEFSNTHSQRHLLCTRHKPNSLLCREKIVDATVKGSANDQKVWVEIEKTIGSPILKAADDIAIVEKRTLVFMPAMSYEEAIKKSASRSRVIKPTNKPDFSVSLVPDSSLLFRFSALTFNAHRIHLDREYARNAEGFRNLVVHGPLSLVLMLKVLSSQIGENAMIKNFTYRNLAPLFADEKMTVCVRRSRHHSSATPAGTDGAEAISLSEAEGTGVDQTGATIQEEGATTKWDVWIEGPEGGYAVKGSAETVHSTFKIPDK